MTQVIDSMDETVLARNSLRERHAYPTVSLAKLVKQVMDRNRMLDRLDLSLRAGLVVPG